MQIFERPEFPSLEAIEAFRRRWGLSWPMLGAELGTDGRHMWDYAHRKRQIPKYMPSLLRCLEMFYASSDRPIVDHPKAYDLVKLASSESYYLWPREKPLEAGVQKIEGVYEESGDLAPDYWNFPVLLGIAYAKRHHPSALQ